MTQNDFLGKIMAAATGDHIIYHTGFLMSDRKIGANFLAAHALALAAFHAMESGVVRLTQRKLGIGRYEYIATKLPAPHKPVQWEGCYAEDKYTAYKRPSRKNGSTLAAVVASACAARSFGAPTGTHA